MRYAWSISRPPCIPCIPIHLYTEYAKYTNPPPSSFPDIFPQEKKNKASNDSLLLLAVAILRINTKLDEDNYVLQHRAETSNQPGCVHEHVISTEGMEHDAGAVGEIAGEGEDEEEEGESYRSISQSIPPRG